MKSRRVLVTGGAGFMGSAFIRFGLKHLSYLERVINLDLLTYAADKNNLKEVEESARYLFVQGDIRDESLVEKLCKEEKIDTLVHFAAETHVDRSIRGPRVFAETNVMGTLALLEVVKKLPHIHFHQISTDEVFGALGSDGEFLESSPYEPNSPYAASKAAADHFVRAYAKTYGLSTTLSHSSNNYGPHQFPEKFIPVLLTKCLQNEPLPVYGDGQNVREWLFVEDHAEAVWKILENGKRGEVYNLGSGSECKNIDLLHILIDELAKQKSEDPQNFLRLITFVPDRLGHDFRYALDCTKIHREIGWSCRHTLAEGLKKTVAWYLTC